MALETLKNVHNIGGFKVMTDADRPLDGIGDVDWKQFDEMRKLHPICIDNVLNMISFRIQNGPVGKNGINGCQVDTVIEASKLIITGLNKQYPCRENAMAITKLDEALMWLDKRTKERSNRGVEGENKL